MTASCRHVLRRSTRRTGYRTRAAILAAAVAGSRCIAWPGAGVAAESIGVGGGELPDAVEEAADHQKLQAVQDGGDTAGGEAEADLAGPMVQPTLKA